MRTDEWITLVTAAVNQVTIADIVGFLSTSTRSEIAEAYSEAKERAQDYSVHSIDRTMYAKLAALLKSVLAMY